LDVFTQVRDACDIVEIISEHIALRRAGREFKGLCPFHEDRRPSMSVVPHKQIFHCFVCGTGGDVFKFVQLYHKMSPGESLRYLAQKKGITLPELQGSKGPKSDFSLREKIAQANERACTFFENSLKSESGKAGLAYLKQRGLTDETIARFRLGFSPGWDAMVTSFIRGGGDTQILVPAGLAKARADGTLYNVFRDRVIFPIADTTRRIIAFGGRILEEKRDPEGNIVEAKYLNTPETELFNKSASLYGLQHARAEISKTGVAVVVEGYMDVIGCHQVGVTNAIATLGTAMTVDHARILKRFCNTIILIFDSDDAGRRAADRALELFVREPLDIKLASVPSGKDPCDFCLSAGGPAMQAVIASAVDAMDFQWRRLAAQVHGAGGIQQRQELLQKFVTHVAAAQSNTTLDPFKRAMLIDKLAKLSGVDTRQVQRMLHERRAVSENAPRPADPSPGSQAEPPAFRPIDARKLTGLPRAEASILSLLLASPELYDQARDQLSVELFAPDAYQPLAIALLEYLDGSADLTACTLAEFLSLNADPQIVSQATSLVGEAEAQTNLDGLSPQHQKMIQQVQADYARPIAETLSLAIEFLRERRIGAIVPDIDPLDGLSPDERDLAQLQAKSRQKNQLGGDPRRLGLGNSSR
jgi:DNA primase